VIGKWCALVAFYALLWLPSLALVGVLRLYLPAGAGIDWGPVLSAFLVVVGVGGTLLAIGLACSAATENQIIAAVLGFSIGVCWLMLGEVGALGRVLNLRSSLFAAARGELRLDSGVMLVGVICTSLAVARVSASIGREKKITSWIFVALFALLTASSLSLALRHPRSLDLSEQNANSLDASTVHVLLEISDPIRITLIRPQEEVFDSVFVEVRLLLRRMQERQPLLAIHEMDSLSDPQGVARWAREIAVVPEDFAGGGALVVQRGQRDRAVDLLSMASFDKDSLGVGSLSGLRAEGAITQAIKQVIADRYDVVCSSVGHGELLAENMAGSLGALDSWARSADALVREGVVVKELRRIDDNTLSACDALLILGPATPLDANEVLSLQRYRMAGGDLLIALRSQPLTHLLQPPSSGLELFLENAGMRVDRAIVVDPSSQLPGPGAWRTYDGYGDHEIVTDFYHRRATVWPFPLALRALSSDVTPLVWASDGAWAETDLAKLYEFSLYEKSSEDLDEGSVALAGISERGSRLVLLGSAEAFSNDWAARGVGGNEMLLLSSVRWMLQRAFAGRGETRQAVRPERVRLVMTRHDLRVAFFYCVIASPLVLVCVGFMLWWWRRREA